MLCDAGQSTLRTIVRVTIIIVIVTITPFTHCQHVVVQGAADFSTIVRDSTIVVKGKLATAALEDFLEQLVSSRSRTVSLAVVKPHKRHFTAEQLADYEAVCFLHHDVRDLASCFVPLHDCAVAQATLQRAAA